MSTLYFPQTHEKRKSLQTCKFLKANLKFYKFSVGISMMNGFFKVSFIESTLICFLNVKQNNFCLHPLNFVLIFDFCSYFLIVPRILFPIFLRCYNCIILGVVNFIEQKVGETFGIQKEIT